jgi:hypothetical protein
MIAHYCNIIVVLRLESYLTAYYMLLINFCNFKIFNARLFVANEWARNMLKKRVTFVILSILRTTWKLRSH